MFLCAHGQTFPSRIHHLSGLQHLVRQHNTCLNKLHTCIKKCFHFVSKYSLSCSVCRHGSWECTNEGCPGERDLQ